MADSSKYFPDPRRIVTGHTDSGDATFIKDAVVPAVPTPYGVNFAVLWQTAHIPASNDGNEDPIDKPTTDLSNKDGVVFRVVDIPGNTTVGSMLYHRTESLDFGILMQGRVTCHLDNDEQRDMMPGDVCVQRGTIHGWTNRWDEPCRIYFVLVAADPVRVGGKELGKTGYESDKVASGGK